MQTSDPAARFLILFFFCSLFDVVNYFYIQKDCSILKFFNTKMSDSSCDVLYFIMWLIDLLLLSVIWAVLQLYLW